MGGIFSKIQTLRVHEPKGDNTCFLGFESLNFLQNSFQLEDYHIELYHKKYLFTNLMGRC